MERQKVRTRNIKVMCVCVLGGGASGRLYGGGGVEGVLG